MNRLAQEKSPYLLQHKDNPVWWWPWSAEALEQARSDNKPIFLSIGYSTCHWCHVMEKESFENEKVAEVLNSGYISIKVDREERPDIDDIYMTAVQALTGGGGWPMSVWLTPDGKPFFAGTYFPRERFVAVLERISQFWTQESAKVKEDSERLTEAMRQLSEVKASELQEEEVFSNILDGYISRFEGVLDMEWGGFGGAPKFPQSMVLSALMRVDRLKGEHRAEGVVRKTLDGMYRGGMYDHLVGGFHRYSVDERWLVPHFEKMLYDNALLAETYLEAFQVYKDPEYRRVAEQVLNYVLSEMTHPQGGFYSAQDADSLVPGTDHKEEGYFATYKYDELTSEFTSEELQALHDHYGVSATGQFEGRNILHLQSHASIFDQDEKVDIKSAFAKLRRIRKERPSPHLDDKIIAAWNGWMIQAMCKGYEVLGDQRYLEAARKGMSFLLENLVENGTKVYRRWREGEARFAGLSDDYAALVAALLSLYQTDFDSRWFKAALLLQTELDRKFWDSKEGGYFRDDASDSTLIMRVKEDYDGVRPNANSLSAHNLLKLYHLTLETDYRDKAEKIFELYGQRMKDYPSSLPTMVSALTLLEAPVKEIVVGGPKEAATQLLGALRDVYQPFRVMAWAGTQGEEQPALAQGKEDHLEAAHYYVCEEGVCHSPTQSLQQAVELISERS